MRKITIHSYPVSDDGYFPKLVTTVTVFSHGKLRAYNNPITEATRERLRVFTGSKQPEKVYIDVTGNTSFIRLDFGDK